MYTPNIYSMHTTMSILIKYRLQKQNLSAFIINYFLSSSVIYFLYNIVKVVWYSLGES